MKFFLLGAFLLPSIVISAFADSATWNLGPTSSDWSTAANWTPETVPNGPGDVATFDQSNVADVTLSKSVKVQSIVFAPGGSAFTISTGPRVLTFSGAGVINNSQLPQNFAVTTTPGFIQFINRADAGDAIYTQTGESGGSTLTYFLENASAGNGTFINQGGDLSAGAVLFYGSSTAANGTFFNRAGTANGGASDFFESSNAGNATIVCDGATPGAGGEGFCFFNDDSSASDATFTVNGASIATGSPAFVSFYGNSTAANATLTLNGGTAPKAPGGRVSFGFSGEGSTAANSTLIANAGVSGGAGGVIAFYNDAIGERARVEVFGNGKLNITQRNPPGVSVGSIEGDGGILLGANNLTVGANNKAATFSGVIADGAHFTNGSLTKIGTGTLTLTGANTYTGGTSVNAGTLLVNNKNGSATGTGAVSVGAATLGGRGIIAGPVTLGSSGTSSFLAPAAGTSRQATLTIQSSLTLQPTATYTYTFKVRGTGIRADQVIANGVTVNAATIDLHGDIQGTLAVGTVLTVVSNASANPITERFNNLPDGMIVDIDGTKFQANYESGDGNDLTLTVVP
jgi:autotransporter-associated beta strand protein